MNEDIVCLLQDLGRENAIDVIANFIIRNPDVEDSIAAKMGSLLFTGNEPVSATSGGQAIAEQATATNSPSRSLFSQAMDLGLAGLVASSSHKMIFVVNMDLGMGRGKQCAQVAHAALGLYLKIQESRNDRDISKMYQWINMGQKKIVVRGNDTEHLKQIKSLAESTQIPTMLVSDAGCTQIAPGSKTVLALFGTNEDLDKITGSLRLL